MHVVIGGGLLAGGLLIVVFLAWLFDGTHGPSWLNAEVTAMLLTIVPTALMGFGAGNILVGLAGDHRPIDLVALLGWLVIGFGLIWLMRRRARRVAAPDPT